MQADSSIDAGYPEAAKLPLAVPAMLIGVMKAVDEGFAGLFEKAVAGTSMTSCLSDDLPMSSPLSDTSLNPAQILTPLDS